MIDWARLNSDKRKSFEELCYQIAERLYGTTGTFTPIDGSGGDGGVEFFLAMPDGTQLGWQAKFFYPQPRLRYSSRKSQIVGSLKAAVQNHPLMTKWILCTPTDFNTSEERWFRTTLQKLAPSVELEHWGDSWFGSAVSKPEMTGIRNYFFGELELTLDWFRHQVEKQIENVRDKKFLPDLHVETAVDQDVHFFLGDEELLQRLSEDESDAQVLRSRVFEANERLRSHARNKNWGAEADSVLALADLMLAEIDAAVTSISRCNECVAEGRDKEARSFDFFSINSTLWDIDERFRAEAEVLHSEKSAEIFGPPQEAGSDVQELDRLLRDVIFGPSHVKSEFEPIWHAAKALQGFKQNRMHVLGVAGIGKTHVTCHVCQSSLASSRPAILLHGGQFSGPAHIEDHVRAILGLPPSCSWGDFLSTLNTCGEVHGTKVLIAIDALNEATDVGLWARELAGFESEIARHSRLALLTTCRQSYKEAIWGESEAPSFVRLYGFGSNDTILAVERYFDHYRIRADLTLAPLEQFSHPLYLRIFCESENPEHESEKQVFLGEQTLFSVFEAFIKQTDRVLAKRLNRLPSARILQKSLPELAELMWNGNLRHVDIDTAARLFDNADFDGLRRDDSITWAVLDEGLAIDRDWQGQGESVSFTYDLFAGYVIATHVLKIVPADEITSLAQSGEFQRKLLSDDYRQLHPLHEDILRCLCVIFPKAADRHLYEIEDDRKAVHFSIKALFEMEPSYIREEQLATLRRLFGAVGNRTILLKMANSTAFSPGHPLSVKFWGELLRTIPLCERDITWTEMVRDDRQDVLERVQRLERICREQQELTPLAQERLHLTADYASWILTSTQPYLRDSATKALYWYGRRYPQRLFRITLDALDINDPYVPERLLAASYGAVMALWGARHDDPDTVNAISDYALCLFDQMFRMGAGKATTHVLKRDYARHTIELALLLKPKMLNKREQKRIRPPFRDGGIREWGRSEDRNEGDYRDGNAPLDFDFVYRDLDSLAPGHSMHNRQDIVCKEVMENILWRIYDLGYSFDVFENIDKQIAGRYYNGRHVRHYGDKYAWIAFYELYGHRFDLGLLESDWREERERPSNCDLDPSFPDEPGGGRLMDIDFLGDRTISLEQWVRQRTHLDLSGHLVRDRLQGENGPWVLLYALALDTDEEAERHASFSATTYLVPAGQADRFTELLSKQRPRDEGGKQVPQVYYTFAGEMPWSDTCPSNGYHDIDLFVRSVRRKRTRQERVFFRDGKELSDTELDELIRGLAGTTEDEKLARLTDEMISVEERTIIEPCDEPIHERFSVMMPVIVNDWEGHHNELNPNQNAVVPARDLAECFDLRLHLPGWGMYDSHGNRASVCVQQKDDGVARQILSYIRLDIIDEYLRANDLCLVWSVSGSREMIVDNTASNQCAGHFHYTFDYRNGSARLIDDADEVVDYGK